MLVSARISPTGTPARLLEAAEGEARRFELAVSKRLLAEVGDALSRPKMRRYLPERAVPIYLERLRAAATVTDDPAIALFEGATLDRDDDHLVALSVRVALSGTGDSYLVSGDRHVLGLPNRLVKDGEGRALSRVLTPREFSDELERRGYVSRRSSMM